MMVTGQWGPKPGARRGNQEVVSFRGGGGTNGPFYRRQAPWSILGPLLFSPFTSLLLNSTGIGIFILYADNIITC